MHKIIRQVTFCAAHRIHSPSLSAQGNKEVFGKFNNIHGHNFKLEATFRGLPVRQEMLCDVNEIDKVLQSEIGSQISER